jgi:hypothetical protein
VNRSKLKRGTLVLTAGALAAIPGCWERTYGSLTLPCCDDAGLAPGGGTTCEPSCYGVAAKPPDAGNDAGIVGFFASDGGKSGN